MTGSIPVIYSYFTLRIWTVFTAFIPMQFTNITKLIAIGFTHVMTIAGISKKVG